MDIDDVHRLAQKAYDDAQKANHAAELAKMAGTSHEALCLERYSTINKKLEDVSRAQSLSSEAHKKTMEKVQATLDVLRSKADKASGIDMALRYAVMLLSGISIAWGLFHGGGHAP